MLFFSKFFFVFIVIRNKMLVYMYGLGGNGSCGFFCTHGNHILANKRFPAGNWQPSWILHVEDQGAFKT